MLRNTATELLSWLVEAISGLPSPSKSAIAILTGDEKVPLEKFSFSLKVVVALTATGAHPNVVIKGLGE